MNKPLFRFSMRKEQRVLATLTLLGTCCFVLAQNASQTKHPYASDKPLTEATVFGDGIISTGSFDSHPAFTPDGKALYFVRSTPNFNLWTIVFSRFEGGRWSTPEVAPFSGQYSDADPFITADGSRLYFISNRPVPGKANRDLDIWMVEKTGSGWGPPKNIGAPVNSPGNEWYPVITQNGTMYFGSDREGGKGRTDIYRCRLVDGKYTDAENLGDSINTPFNEFEAFVASDESFLILMCGGRPDARGGFDLYISHNQNGKWTKPANLGDKINSVGNEYSPTISPDGKYFFWTSARGAADSWEKQLDYKELSKRLQSSRNGLGDIYYIDLSALNIAR
jgi:Tol biopolymer transport system component